MSRTPSSAGPRVLLIAALLLPIAFLGACAALGGGDDCRGAASELRRLAEQPVLGVAPARASAPANYRGVGVTTGCDDDSGGAPWLHAERLYAFPGRPEDVISFYTGAAASAGWELEEDSSATLDGVCWTRIEQGRHLVLDVELRPGGFSPEPEVGAGIAYSVSVGSERDGGVEGCGG
ncbi:hypothetical protein DWG14_03819 [Streptomyces griseorubiginosus]|uniref:Lipoprotein n=1 Tax=Streptomyces griseorubiginosus TaxID=67304 RepID=A0AAI8KYL5_9ACTN|nr:hypothetical protein DWG14_03819 [Streptomyces griseorubiginosus]